MKEYCAECHSEVDETEISQNQAELKNNGLELPEIPQVICAECQNSK